MSITTALKARRDALGDREAGFTLIELLVVVLIIGILAAIAIPVYLGVQNSAKDSGVQSDLAADKTAVVAYLTNNPTATVLPVLPPTTTSAGGPELIKDGFTYNSVNYAATNPIKYATGSTTSSWCIDAISKQTTTFAVSMNTGVAKGTTCTALTSAKW